MIEWSKKSEDFVGKAENLTPVTQFGFDIDTCCGFIPQDNTWQGSWLVQYYIIMNAVHKANGLLQCRSQCKTFV